MKALLLYFSGTGNTEYVAKKIQEKLSGRSVEAELHSIEKDAVLQRKEYDFLFVGAPKYYEYPAIPIFDYLKNKLPKTESETPVFAFVTEASASKTSFAEMKKILKQKNYRLKTARTYSIANNLLIFDMIKPTAEDKKMENLRLLEHLLEDDIKSFLDGETKLEDPGFFASTIGKISGHAFTKLFPLFFMRYSADKNECIGCGKCSRECPAENIQMKDGYPVFGRRCLCCTRCINQCPTNAVLYRKKRKIQYKRLCGTETEKPCK